MKPDVLANALAKIASDLSKLDGRARPDKLVGMGGAVTNIAAVKHRLATYDPAVIQGSELDRGGDRPADRGSTARRAPRSGGRSSACNPRRADVILAGACIVRTIMEKLGHDKFTVSDRGAPPRSARGEIRAASRRPRLRIRIDHQRRNHADPTEKTTEASTTATEAAPASKTPPRAAGCPTPSSVR